jgi:hypothetical protein
MRAQAPALYQPRPVQQTRVGRLFLGPAAFPVAVFFEVVHQVADRQAGVLGRSVSSPIRAPSGLRFWKTAMWAPRTSSDPICAGRLHVEHDPVVAGPSRAGRAGSF